MTNRKRSKKPRIPINERMIYFRKLKGFSQGDMAKHLKMSQGNYGKIERGEIGVTLSLLENFADICEMSVTALISINQEELEAKVLEQQKKIVELQQELIQLLKKIKK